MTLYRAALLLPGNINNAPKIVILNSTRMIHSTAPFLSGMPQKYHPKLHEDAEKARQSYLGETHGHHGKTELIDVDAAPRSVGFIGKLVYRFNGKPLPSEKQAPEALFQNVGRDFLPPEPLPPFPKDYKEHPERDLVNFPFPAKHNYPPKNRMIWFPDSWFKPIEKITGTSGAYVAMLTSLGFLVNKEILVWDLGWALWFTALWYYLIIRHAGGTKIDEYFYKRWQKDVDAHKQEIANDLEMVKNFRTIQDSRKGALVAAKENFPAILKENMALQLEANYRRNVQAVATDIKRKIDYLKETETVKQRFERTIFLNQIIEGVRRSIETNDGGIKDAYLDSCIDQLRGLAAKQ